MSGGRGQSRKPFRPQPRIAPYTPTKRHRAIHRYKAQPANTTLLGRSTDCPERSSATRRQPHARLSGTADRAAAAEADAPRTAARNGPAAAAAALRDALMERSRWGHTTHRRVALLFFFSDIFLNRPSHSPSLLNCFFLLFATVRRPVAAAPYPLHYPLRERTNCSPHPTPLYPSLVPGYLSGMRVIVYTRLLGVMTAAAGAWGMAVHETHSLSSQGTSRLGRLGRYLSAGGGQRAPLPRLLSYAFFCFFSA